MPLFAVVPLDEIQPHPNNVRRVAKPTDEMVDSVRAAGVLEPVLLGPVSDDGVRWIIAGNRRYYAAVEAGLTSLPAVLRDDLVTEAQQLEAMLVENLHRSDLTAVEEADAYTQLELFGMNDKAIAAATGRAVKTVKARKRLATLPEAARTKLHEGQATLADVEALLEVEDADLQASLAEDLGGKDFAYRLATAHDRQKRVARNTRLIEGFRELGAIEVPTSSTTFRVLSWYGKGPLSAPEPHIEAMCLGYRDWGAESYTEPFLGCVAPDSHVTEDPEPDPAELEAAEAWAAELEVRKAEEAARATAAKVRGEHVAGWIEGLLTYDPKAIAGVADLARVVVPTMVANLDSYGVDSNLLDHLLGLELDPDQPAWTARQEARETFLANFAESTASKAVEALASVLASIVEGALTGPDYQYEATETDRDNAATAWAWLTQTGYELSTVDEQVRDTATHHPDDKGDEDGGTW